MLVFFWYSLYSLFPSAPLSTQSFSPHSSLQSPSLISPSNCSLCSSSSDSSSSPLRVLLHTHSELHAVLPVCFNTRVNLIRWCWVQHSVTHLRWGHCEKSPFVLDGVWNWIRNSHIGWRHYHSLLFVCSSCVFLKLIVKDRSRNHERQPKDGKEWNSPNELHFLSRFSFKETNFIKFPRLFNIGESQQGIWHGFHGSPEGHDPILCLADQIWDCAVSVCVLMSLYVCVRTSVHMESEVFPLTQTLFEHTNNQILLASTSENLCLYLSFSPSVALRFSLSLSQTHTHTHTHTEGILTVQRTSCYITNSIFLWVCRRTNLR